MLFLNNRRTAQRIRNAGKRFGRFICGKKIRNCLLGRKELVSENFGCDKSAKTEFTRKAVIRTMVLVCNLGFIGFVWMNAMFFRIGRDQMLERMHRLKYNRRQDRCNQSKVYYGEPFFHLCKDNLKYVKINLTFCKTNFNSSFVASKPKPLNE